MQSRLQTVRLTREPSTRGAAVIVWGWAAGDLRHVSKYASLWLHQLDANDVTVVATPLGICKRPTEAQVEAAVAPIVHAVGDRAIVHHVFSNGGLVYGSRAMRMSAGRNRLVVMDSSPSLDHRPHIPSIVVAESLGKRPAWLKWIVYWLVRVVLTLGMLVSSRGSSPELKRLFGYEQLARVECPLVFLYSAGDKITSAALLERFAKTELAHQRVSLVDFGDSAHVAHYRKYPQRYVESLRAALSKLD